ncbi:MAG: hypothetical protein LBI53_08100 [Candidatus Peribacteria bacterium]|jgi:hypothetical protein|nr:hypothetical protein [Candidatus Peribacteria bacterium]
MERANFRDIYKSHALKHKIDTLENEKRALLNTREVVAAYELHKLALYAQQLQEGKLVQTPSVQAMKRHLRTEIFSGKTLLLS